MYLCGFSTALRHETNAWQCGITATPNGVPCFVYENRKPDHTQSTASLLKISAVQPPQITANLTFCFSLRQNVSKIHVSLGYRADPRLLLDRHLIFGFQDFDLLQKSLCAGSATLAHADARR